MKSWLDVVKQKEILIDELELFLQTNASGYVGVNERDESGSTPLMIVVRQICSEPPNVSLSGHDIVDLLIDNGADVNEDLFEFLIHDRAELLFRIVQRALLEASSTKLVESSKRLLNFANKYGLDTYELLNDLCYEDGRFPLHCAVMRGNTELTELLMVNKASVSEKNRKNETPLSYAREYYPTLFFSMMDLLMLQYSLDNKSWRLHTNDSILEEVLKSLSITFTWKLPASVSGLYCAQNLKKLQHFANQLDRKELVRIILQLGEKIGDVPRRSLREEILNAKKRSMLAELFAAPDSYFSFFSANKGYLKEIGEGLLVESKKESFGTLSIFSRNCNSKKYKSLDFSDFVAVSLST